MSQSLKGKIALVTGGARGIGEAIALKFASAGTNVVVSDVNLEQARKVAAKIKKKGRQSLALKCDVSNSKDVRKMRDRIIKRFSRPDILVNDAGISKIS